MTPDQATELEAAMARTRTRMAGGHLYRWLAMDDAEIMLAEIERLRDRIRGMHDHGC